MTDLLAVIAFLAVVLMVGFFFVRFFVLRDRADVQRMANPAVDPDLDRHEVWIRDTLIGEADRYDPDAMADRWRDEDERSERQ